MNNKRNLSSDFDMILDATFSQRCVKDALYKNQNTIQLVDAENGNRYLGVVHRAKHEKKEKYVGNSWYDYAKIKRL